MPTAAKKTHGNVVSAIPQWRPPCEKNSPFDQLKPGEYFLRRAPQGRISFEEDYFTPTAVDPDGKLRHLLEEREHKLADIKSELAYINALPAGRLLDVGCGLGEALSGISDAWERHGVEPSKFASQHAAQWGKIHCGYLDAAGYPDDYFDVVLFNHVLEHIADPLPVLREVRRVIKPAGSLVIIVPNFDSGCARRFGENYRFLDDPTHVTCLSPESLRRLLRDTGFKVTRTEYPFFDTNYFTRDNFDRLQDTSGISPAFYGNVMSFYARKMTPEEARELLDVLEDALRSAFGENF